jgi:hypothetical protein
MDTITIVGLVIGIVSAIAAVIAAIAAVAAVLYAKKAPTKEDLERVETHIARVDDHLSEQNQRDLSTSRAERVSISVNGRNRLIEPLTLVLTVKDPGVTLLRIELVNDLGMFSGMTDCLPSDPLSFIATIPPEVAQRWFGSCRTGLSTNQKLAPIRAFMKIEGREVHRTFSVNMTELTQQWPNMQHSEQIFSLSGTC